MKLIEMKCKNCGSVLEVEEGAKTTTCKYCHTTFAIDDEIQHIQHDNMFESGYEFEKGRIQAKSEKETEETQEFKKARGIITFVSVIIFVLVFIIFFFVFFKIFGANFNRFSTTTSKSISEQQAESGKSFFNYGFERYSGTNRTVMVDELLDEVVTNNKTNKSHLITVVYGETNTIESDEIINIKHSLEEYKDFEVTLDYDESGYVNKVTITNI